MCEGLTENSTTSAGHLWCRDLGAFLAFLAQAQADVPGRFCNTRGATVLHCTGACRTKVHKVMGVGLIRAFKRATGTCRRCGPMAAEAGILGRGCSWLLSAEERVGDVTGVWDSDFACLEDFAAL